MQGQVTKILSSAYRVSANGAEYCAVARGKVRLQGDIFVGDEVRCETLKDGSLAIAEVLPRKNVLIRPYVSNIDAVLIVIAPEPLPELLLVDKIMINAYQSKIEPILIYNKNDLAGNFEGIKKAYQGILPLYSVSTATKNGIKELMARLAGKTVCFAGQSAVGKTSLLNAFFELAHVKSAPQKVDGVSEKSRRGKNTTRHVELFDLGSLRVVDTCGFNMLECGEGDERNLPLYYEEYLALACACRFRGCCHMEEPNCAVKAAVLSGELDSGRYERYQQIYTELKEKRGEKYD